MLRLASRFLGFWLVAAALVVAVVDGAKSIAASSLVTTPLAETYATLAALAQPEPGNVVAPLAAPWPLDVPLAWLMSAPTVAVLAIPGVVFLILGAKRRRPFLSREYAA